MILSGWEVVAAFGACALIGAILESCFRDAQAWSSDVAPSTLEERAEIEYQRLEDAETVCLEQAAHGDPVFMWRDIYDVVRRCKACGTYLTNTWAPQFAHSTSDDARWNEYAIVVRDCGNCGLKERENHEGYVAAIVNACATHERLEQARDAWLSSELEVFADDAIPPAPDA